MNTRPGTYYNACEVKKRFSREVILRGLFTARLLFNSYWIRVYSIALGIKC